MSTLTTDELDRIRAEVGGNVVGLGAEPYIGHVQLYEIIRANVSSSSVAATSNTGAYANGLLPLASVTGLAVGYKVQVDVGPERETVTIRTISGSSIGVVLRKSHTGTFPVELESALTLVRGLLAELALMDDQIALARTQDSLVEVQSASGDRVRWRDGTSASDSRVGRLRAEQARMREDLANLLNLRAILAQANPAGGSYEVY